jgi:hypothetical protein
MPVVLGDAEMVKHHLGAQEACCDRQTGDPMFMQFLRLRRGYAVDGGRNKVVCEVAANRPGRTILAAALLSRFASKDRLLLALARDAAEAVPRTRFVAFRRVA